MDVSEYEDGDFDKWRIWKSIWKNVLWRSDVSEYLYRTGREWTDRICIQLSGFDQAFEIGPGQEYIFQKKAFLAGEPGVNISVHFHKKVASGLFGGEGFILQKVSGNGIVFAEFDGHVVEYELQPGQQIVIDSGYLAAMSVTCQMDIQTVPGLKNIVFGGEGLFNTVITGPGHVWLQTMPISSVADSLRPYFPTSSK